MAEKEEGDIESPASERSPVSWQTTDDESISEAKENAIPDGIAGGSKPPPTKEAACRTEKRVWGCLRRRYAIGMALGVAAAVAATVIALVLCLVVLPSRADQPVYIGTEVDLGYARYAGMQVNSDVLAFLGMRYAAPPMGELRWRAPVEPPSINSTQDANTFPPVCLSIGAGYPATGQSEDCLFLNLWAPANSTTESKLPVWVFIPGGGYTAIANGNWNGTEVVEKSGGNVVMLSFSYRVGLYGFLASERVRQDGDLNVGMLDQRMVLAWIKNHIAQFGGDPDHVVIHGASAGAGSVGLHLVAYGGRNDSLFHGGIGESLFFPDQPTVGELEYQFDRVMQQSGCASVPENQQMSCLRSKNDTALQVLNNGQAFPGRTASPPPLFYWTPCIDGDLFPDLPYTLFQTGKFVHAPVLFGTATNEGSMFAFDAHNPAEMINFFSNNYPKLTANDTDTIVAMYPQMPPLPQHQAWFPSTSMAYGEATFICPTVNILNAVQAGGGGSGAPGIYSYRYNVQDDQLNADGLGVVHTFEAAAVFGPDNVGGIALPSYYTYNAPIIPVVMNYVISFVRTLDPNPYRAPGAPVWEPWASGQGMGRLLFETNNSRMEVTPQDQLARCEFWLGVGMATAEQ